MSDSPSYQVPDDLLYTKEHEWARFSGGAVKVGITDYAAKTLNDIVYLTLPSPGKEVKQLGQFGTVESIKAVSELYAPLSGTITSINQQLADHPELINKSPYAEGWIIELRCSRPDDEKRSLLTAGQYRELLKSLDH